MPENVTPHEPHDPAITPQNAHDTIQPPGTWDGPTYYGRPQLKQAPFKNWVVGGYIFLAGVSGGASMLSAIAGAKQGSEAAGTVRNGRYLSLLTPTLGSALLIWDLHTPARFYNMLRIAKRTSPMSIGTWILVSFSGLSFISAGLQFIADRFQILQGLSRAARVIHVPAAVAGAGLSTYTASLLASTSTPLWAAAPGALAVRFGSSSLAAGAAALSLGEQSASIRRMLDTVTMAALVSELAATAASHDIYERKGVSEALDGGWGRVERDGATGLGVITPICLHALSLTLFRRPGRLSALASLAALAGSLLLRVSIMAVGDRSARRPEISLRFSQPRNLPKVRARRRRKRLLSVSN